MGQGRRALLFAVAIAAVTHLAQASPAGAEVSCPKAPGMIPGPMVTTPEAAEQIYLTIARARGDKLEVAAKRVVWNEGDHWTVFQSFKQPADGSVSFGGGLLEMRIAKCNGAISASYSR